MLKRWLSFVFLVLVASGCSIFGASDTNELDDARARWVRANIVDYNFTLTVSCFCTGSGVFDVQIRDREVVSVSPTNDISSGKTIDDLFAELAAAYAQGADQISATYDASLGFPASISIDYFFDAVDDEITYAVDNFQQGG